MHRFFFLFSLVVLCCSLHTVHSQGCGIAAQIDIALCIDVSGSITAPVFEDSVRPFVIQLSQTLLRPAALSGNIRVGAISFGSSSTVVQPLNVSESVVVNTLQTMVYSGGSTNMISCLNAAQTMLSVQTMNRRRALVLITDGVADDSPVAAADAAKASGIEIFTLGVGTSISQSELSSLGSSPPNSHNFVAQTFQLLLVSIVRLTTSIRQAVGNACTIFGDPHYVTFDGSSFSTQSTGDYWAIRSAATDPKFSWNVQVRHLPCFAASSQTCARGFAMRTSAETISVFYETDSSSVLLFHNGVAAQLKPLLSGSLWTSSVSNTTVSIKREAPSTVIVVVDYGPLLHRAEIRFSVFSSSAILRPHPILYGSLYGLCGFYDGCPDDDFSIFSTISGIIPSNATSRVPADVAAFVSASAVSSSLDSFFPSFLGYASPVAAPVSAVSGPGDPAFTAPASTDASYIACSNALPGVSSTSFLFQSCLFDVVTTGNIEYATSSSDLLIVACNALCKEGLPSIPIVNTTTCQYQCDLELLGTGISQPVDFHATYGGAVVPPLNFVQQPNGSLLVSSKKTLGGTYMIAGSVSSPCSGRTANTSVVIACSVGLTVSTIVAPQTVVPDPLYGYPVVKLTIPVIGGVSGRSLYFSWKMIQGSDAPFLTAESGQSVMWQATRPGSFSFEVAVYDGCNLQKLRWNVSAQCPDCTSSAALNPAVTMDKDAVWNKTSSVGAFRSVLVRPLIALGLGPQRGVPYSESFVLQEASIQDYPSAVFVLANTTSQSKSYSVFVPGTASRNLSDPVVVNLPKTIVVSNTTLSASQVSMSSWGGMVPAWRVPLAVYTTTISTTLTSVRQLKAIPANNLCNITLSPPSPSNNAALSTSAIRPIPDVQPSTTTVSVIPADPSSPSKCVGTYTIGYHLESACSSASATGTATVACGPAPLIKVFDTLGVANPFNPITGVIDPITWNASRSVEPYGRQLSYLWTLQYEPANGGTIISSNSTSPAITFAAPGNGGRVSVNLVLSNGCSAARWGITKLLTSSVSLRSLADESLPVQTRTMPQTTKQFGKIDADDSAVALKSNWNAALRKFSAVLLPVGGMTDMQLCNAERLSSFVSFESLHNAPFISATPLQSGTYHVRVGSKNICEMGGNTGYSIHADCRFAAGQLTLSTLGSSKHLVLDRHRGVGTIFLSAEQTRCDADMKCEDENLWTYSWELSRMSSGRREEFLFAQGIATSLTITSPGVYELQLTVTDGCTAATERDSIVVEVVEDTHDDDLDAVSVVLGCGSFVPNVGGTAKTVVWNSGQSFGFETSLSADLSTLDAGRNFANYTFLWEVISAPQQSVLCQVQTVVVNSSVVQAQNVTQETDTERTVFYNTTTTSTTTAVTTTVRLGPVSTATRGLFNIPFIPLDVPGSYVVQLSMSDSSCTKTATVTLTAVCNSPPAARIVSTLADSSMVMLNDTGIFSLFLNGTSSSDADSDPLGFSWTVSQSLSFSTSPAVSDASSFAPLLSETQEKSTWLTVRAAGTYVVQLTVSDGCSASTTTFTLIANCSLFDLSGPFVSGNGILPSFSTSGSSSTTSSPSSTLLSASSSIATLYMQGSYIECDGTFSWRVLSYTSTVAPPPTPSNPSSGNGSEASGSAGLIAGVVIACIVVVSAGVGAAVYFIRKRRTAAATKGPHSQEPTPQPMFPLQSPASPFSPSAPANVGAPPVTRPASRGTAVWSPTTNSAYAGQIQNDRL
eukprot:ANDGO_06878.mRNA.1 von Willebrand factor type A domain containing protein